MLFNEKLSVATDFFYRFPIWTFKKNEFGRIRKTGRLLLCLSLPRNHKTK